PPPPPQRRVPRTARLPGPAGPQAAGHPPHPRPRPHARLGGGGALRLLPPGPLRLPLAAAARLLALLRRGPVRDPTKEVPQTGRTGRLRRRRADADRLHRHLQYPPRQAVRLEEGHQVLPAAQGQTRPITGRPRPAPPGRATPGARRRVIRTPFDRIVY